VIRVYLILFLNFVYQMENNNNDFTDVGSLEYDYGSTDVELCDETYLMIVGSQGKSAEKESEQNVDEQNIDDDNTGVDSSVETGDKESDDGGCSVDYSAGDKGEDDESKGYESQGYESESGEIIESEGDESEGHGSEGDKNLNEDDDVAAGEEMVRINSVTAETIRDMEFASVDEPYDFYLKYSKCKGFAVRKSDIRRNVNGEIVMRQYVCNKQGFREKKHLSRSYRKRDHRHITRTKCPSRLCVHYKPKKGRYVVFIFEEGHNHELTPSSVVHLHPVYQQISEADKAQIDGLQSHGIRTCHIMGYMVAQKGGYPGVGFTKKDLYNYFDKKIDVVNKDGDVSTALNYLNVKSLTDPHSFCEYSATDDGRLKCLFWADGTSRSNYFCFGDVVAFDTTYNKNKYNYPLVILSSCNYHSQTVIFGVALVMDETIETYKWVLTSFLNCMAKKLPKVVVTDGDGSMREAIKEVFPTTRHRLCAWFLNKNVVDNVKNSTFLDGFKKRNVL